MARSGEVHICVAFWTNFRKRKEGKRVDAINAAPPPAPLFKQDPPMPPLGAFPAKCPKAENGELVN